MIELGSVSLTYRGAEKMALAEISLKVGAGELVALIGPSGAGKSSMIRVMNGLVRPDQGTVSVFGQEVTALRGDDLRAVRRKVGVIFQDLHLIDRLSVQTNVVSGRLGRYPFWRAALGLWSAGDLADARELLGRVGLEGMVRPLARELSGGQRQRVAIARAMMQEPRVLLGDEPVSSLDPVTGRSVMQLVADLTAERKLVTILSLHDVRLAREFCTRAVGVRAGRIIYDGPMSSLTEGLLQEIYSGESAHPGVDQQERLSPGVAL